MKGVDKGSLTSTILTKYNGSSFAKVQRKIFKTSKISNFYVFDNHISQNQHRSDMPLCCKVS